jgi:hypothetical protein
MREDKSGLSLTNHVTNNTIKPEKVVPTTKNFYYPPPNKLAKTLWTFPLDF